MSGSVRKPRISPLGDMTGARNNCNPEDLTDSPVSSTGMAIVPTEAIVVTAHPNKGLRLRAHLTSKTRLQTEVILLIRNDPITIYG
jgi:hypothetical protein